MADEHLTAHEKAVPMQRQAQGPLLGLKIIDITTEIAGPWAGMMLADLGADVIKVEPPGGENQRRRAPFTLDDDERAYGGAYATYNRNKRSIMLDLKDEADRDTLRELIDTADALIENMKTGAMDGFGLSYEELSARNPRLVYAAVRGFGDPRTGASPYAEWPAYDVVAQSMGGLVSMNGAAPGEEVKVGPFVGDTYPGTLAALGVVSALLHAQRTGEGQFVDVGMVDAIAMLAEVGLMRHTYTGLPTHPAGNRSEFLVPFDIFATKDGHCAIGAPTNRHWVVLAELIGRPDLIDDERTNEPRLRVRNRELVDPVVADWAAARTTAEVVEVLGGHVPVGPVNRPADLFDDPHFQGREVLVAVEQAAGRPTVQIAPPIRFTGTPSGIYRRAPRLDEHGAEIRAEIEAEKSAGTE